MLKKNEAVINYSKNVSGELMKPETISFDDAIVCRLIDQIVAHFLLTTRKRILAFFSFISLALSARTICANNTPKWIIFVCISE